MSSYTFTIVTACLRTTNNANHIHGHRTEDNFSERAVSGIKTSDKVLLLEMVSTGTR